MADKEFIFEIKANISSLQKDLKASKQETQDLKDNFGAFGITVGSVKQKFKEFRQIVANGFKQIAIQSKLAMNGFKLMFGGKVRTGAKVLFNVIKTGVAATGIGLLVVAFASLVTWFTKTKVGAELLERTFTGIGAAVDVIVDRVSKFGGAIVKLFKGDTKGALQDVKDTFTGIGDEIQREITLMVELKRQSQELRDSDRALRVETAQRRAEIESLKLVAEDLTNSEKERLEAAQSAFDIENDLLNKRLANAAEAVRIQEEQIKTSENLEEDLDKLADLEVSLADIRAESTTKQIELNNKINGIKREAEAKEIAASEKLAEIKAAEKLAAEEKAEADQKAMDEENQRKSDEYDLLEDLREENMIAEIEDLQDKALKELEIQKKSELEKLESYENFEELKAEIDEKYKIKTAAVNESFKKDELKWEEMTKEQKLKMAGDSFSQLSEIMGKESAAGKAAAIAQATINTYLSATAAYAALAGVGPIGPVLGAIAAAAAVAAGLANVKAIIATGDGGGSAPAPAGGGGSVPTATPRTEIQSGAFTLGGGEEPEAARAYVVSDDISNSQNQLANIRRRATI